MQKRLINIFLIINIIVWTYLAVNSLLISWVNKELDDEHVYFSKDSILVNIVVLIFVYAIMIVFCRYCTKHNYIRTKTIAIVLGFVATAISIYWVIGSKTSPQADAYAVCIAASRMNSGDYTDLMAGEYVAVYPQQLGLITIMRVLFLLFGDMNYQAYQIMSSLCVFIIVYSVYEMTKILSHDNEIVEIFGLILAFLCLPMYMYTAFVYGEILSTTLIMVALVLFLKTYVKPTIIRYILLAFTSMIAIMARKNSLIFVIAMLVILAVKILFNDKRKTAIFMAVAIIIGTIMQSVIISALYDSHWEDETTHLPALLWIAMGTNDDYGYPGWYNGMATNIYWDNNFDEEASKEAAVEVIKTFAGVCIDNPIYGLDFYNRKITAQWCAPMYQGVVMNNNIEGVQPPIIDAIFHDEKEWKIMDAFMNQYQLVLYSAILILLISMWKNRREGMEFYVGLMVVFGGFLFSILWEAKTRYIFPYLIVLLPYAAIGLYNAKDVWLRGKKQ